MIRFLIKHFEGDGLKAKALKSSSITFTTYGLEQILRLISNLILTRLLYPEAFGIMAIASTILIGLGMLSDIGIEQSIIQNKRGIERNFRNTAWVAQILRGFLLWFLACVISYPTAMLYESPILFPLISALGASMAIKGFSTTAIAVGNKNLKIFKLSVVNIGTQTTSIILTILFAVYTQSVWALVWGNIFASLAGVITGHIYLNDGFRHRFKMDRNIMLQIISFGKWIFVSSIFGFLANQADKMIIGKMLSLTELGIFTIAMTLAQMPRAILFSLNRMVLFPIYSKIQDETTTEIRKKVYRSKLLIITALLPISIFFLIFGQDLIQLLYDERYTDAGWMLQILAVGISFQISTNVGPFYLGFGRSGLFAFTVGIKAFLLIFSMFLGGLVMGKVGLVIGITASCLFYYFIEIVYLKKYDIWFWKTDLSLTLLIALISTGLYIY